MFLIRSELLILHLLKTSVNHFFTGRNTTVNNMGNQRIILIVLVVIAAIVFGAYKMGVFSSEEEVAVDSGRSRASRSIPVSGLIAQPQVLESKITITGSVIANESVEIASEISGKIESIFFDEGTDVKKGDLLLTLNSDELEAQYEKLKYSKKLREDSEYRQRKLLEKEAISQEEYEIALTELNTSIADIKLVEAQLSKTKIRAPFSGIIGLRYVSEGSYINTNTRIAYLASINPVKLEFSVPGKYSSKIKNGDKIIFNTDATKKNYEGQVYAIDPQIDQNTRTLKIRAISQNTDGTLVPGQFAKIELILQEADDAIMLPTEAVIPQLSGHKIYKFENGIAKELSVEIGIRTSTQVEIVNGLSLQDTVLVSGLLQIKDGSAVDITTLN